MPPEVAVRTYRQNKSFYDPILENPAIRESRDTVKASAILISGCQDNQLSIDGVFNGLFTANLLQVTILRFRREAFPVLDEPRQNSTITNESRVCIVVFDMLTWLGYLRLWDPFP
jgi:hypothetical protein